MSIVHTLTIAGLFCTALGLVLNALSVLYSAQQYKNARRIAQGEFLFNLDASFKEHQPVHVALCGAGWPDGRIAPETVEEWAAVVSYMGLFERIQVLIRNGIVDLGTIDRLYGYRLFYIVRNPVIRQLKLEDRKDQWRDFIDLWQSLEAIGRDRQLGTAPNEPLPLRHTAGLAGSASVAVLLPNNRP